MFSLPIKFLFSPFGKTALIALAFALIVGGIYLKGRADGRAKLVAQLEADRVQVYKDGKRIDDEIYAADDPALCVLLGGCGLPDEADGN